MLTKRIDEQNVYLVAEEFVFVIFSGEVGEVGAAFDSQVFGEEADVFVFVEFYEADELFVGFHVQNVCLPSPHLLNIL